jgi:hypothetical protein
LRYRHAVNGLSLCRAFFFEAVEPILGGLLPGLRYAAARVGPGSDVLGFDTARSVDHDWGPRLELFLSTEDVDRHGARINAVLADRLPKTFRGWPTHFEPPVGRVRVMAPTDGPIAHRVVVTDAATWCAELLGFDPRIGVTTVDWLATPSQRLAEVTGGAVFRDDLGELTRLRNDLAWYPDDIWRYLLACQWLRIAEEEPFVGRIAEAGDGPGHGVVIARLVRDVMRLSLLLGRVHPPYTKWLGTAFARLPRVQGIATALDAALNTNMDADRRQAALCDAYEAVGAWQNGLALTEPVEATRRPFYDRPYPVIDAARFATALLSRVTDPEVAALPPVGAVDQWADSVAVLMSPALCRRLTESIMTLPRDSVRS